MKKKPFLLFDPDCFWFTVTFVPFAPIPDYIPFQRALHTFDKIIDQFNNLSEEQEANIKTKYYETKRGVYLTIELFPN